VVPLSVSRTARALALVVALATLAPVAPAAAEYDGSAWTKQTIYTSSAGNFSGRDATLAQRPDGSFVEVFLTPAEDATYPLTLLARTGDPDAGWGPVEVVTDDEDDTTPYSIEAFSGPDGSVVAVWRIYLDGQSVLRSSVRAPAGGWSEPEDVGAGQLTIRGIFRGPASSTLAWTESDGTLHSRTWADGGWEPELTAAGTFPSGAESYAWAMRKSDGQITVAVARDEALYLSQLDPGEQWSDPVRSHEKLSACEVDVGVKDANGNIMAIVTLCYQSVVMGLPGATYAPNGDLHVWWNSWSGMNHVQGLYPGYSIVCDCTHGVSGGVAAGGDLAAVAGVATLGSGALLPGMPRSADRRSFTKVWDDDGDLTMFVGGLGDYGRTINVYRSGDTFADPVATFQAPGSAESGRSGYVSEAFVSGDDILVGYQHSAPASNIGPGGSCNSRLLRADNTLSEPLGQCFDGNTTNYTAVQAPDGSVAVATAAVRYFYFSRFLAVEPPDPVAPTITLAGPQPTYGAAGLVDVTVTGAGAPATGSVRLRYAGATIATVPLGADGTAQLPIGRTALTPGSRTVTVDYLGSDTVLAGSAQRVLQVRKATPRAPAVSVTKRPTPRKPGKVRVTVSAPATGLARPTGKVQVTLRKGSTTTTRSGTLTNGVVTIAVPKLAKGTWRLTARYVGDTHYAPRSSTQVTVKVLA
jgi:hypothetical protein